MVVWLDFKGEELGSNGHNDVPNSLLPLDMKLIYKKIIKTCTGCRVSDLNSEGNLRDWVEKLAKQHRILLVIDNAETIPEETEMERALFNLRENCVAGMLATSRYKDGRFGDARRLQPLTEKDACELFCQAWDADGLDKNEQPEKDVIRDTVKKLDYNPLCIRWMVWAAESYSGDFQTLVDNELRGGGRNILMNYLFDKLLEDTDSLQKAVLYLAAGGKEGSLPKNQILQTILLSRQAAAFDENMSDEDAAKEVDIDNLYKEVEDDINDALDSLKEKSLLRISGSENGGMVTITPLLVPLVVDKYSADENELLSICYDEYIERFDSENNELFSQLNLPEEKAEGLKRTQQAQLAAAWINWNQFNKYYYGIKRVSGSGERRGNALPGILRCLKNVQNALPADKDQKIATARTSLEMLLNAYKDLRDFVALSRGEIHFKAYLMLAKMYSYLDVLNRQWEALTEVKELKELDDQRNRLNDLLETNWVKSFIGEYGESAEYGYAVYTFYAILEKRRLLENEKQKDPKKKLPALDLRYRNKSPEASLEDKLDIAIAKGKEKATQAEQMRFNYRLHMLRGNEDQPAKKRKRAREDLLKVIDEFIGSLPPRETKIRAMQDKFSVLVDLIHLYKAGACTAEEAEKYMKQAQEAADELLTLVNEVTPDDYYPLNFVLRALVTASRVFIEREPKKNLMKQNKVTLTWVIDRFLEKVNQKSDAPDRDSDEEDGDRPGKPKESNALQDGDKENEEGEYCHASFLNFRYLPEAFLNRAKASEEKEKMQEDPEVRRRMREDYERAYTARLRYPAKKSKDGAVDPDDDQKLNNAMERFREKLEHYYKPCKPFEEHRYIILYPHITYKREPAHGFILYDLDLDDGSTARAHYDQLNASKLKEFEQQWDDEHSGVITVDDHGRRTKIWYSKVNWSAARLMEHYIKQCDEPELPLAVFELYRFRSFKNDEEFYAVSLGKECTKVGELQREELPQKYSKILEDRGTTRKELKNRDLKEKDKRGKITGLPYIRGCQWQGYIGIEMSDENRTRNRKKDDSALFFEDDLPEGLEPGKDLHHGAEVIFDLCSAELETEKGGTKKTDSILLAQNIRLASQEPIPISQPQRRALDAAHVAPAAHAAPARVNQSHSRQRRQKPCLTEGATGIVVKVIKNPGGSKYGFIRCESFGRPTAGAPENTIKQLTAAQKAAKSRKGGEIYFFYSGDRVLEWPEEGASVRFNIGKSETEKGYGYTAYGLQADT